MAHVRQQIREAIAAAVTGLATTGSRVFQSRIRPLADTDLPCLLVMTDDETISLASMDASAILSRDLGVTIKAVAKAATALDDTLDDIMAEVETALGASGLGGAHLLNLSSIAIDMDDSLEKPVGVATMRYVATYFTAAAAPETSL